MELYPAEIYEHLDEGYKLGRRIYEALQRAHPQLTEREFLQGIEELITRNWAERLTTGKEKLERTWYKRAS